MATRLDWFTIAFCLTLALTCNKAKADELPDASIRGGIVASEVHAAPVIGPADKDEAVAIHATTRDARCAAGWTIQSGVCLPGDL
jgi:hypothetical protein